jgi:hypothetical protein
MVMKLEGVVPFGRSFDEYQKMFSLSSMDLQLNILGIADGPASFNTEASKLGIKVTSIDPIYSFSGDEIKSRFDAVVDDIILQVKATPNDWNWSYHHCPDTLKESRQRSIELFLQDYELGKQECRYQIGELPRLDFKNDRFNLVLCSHFLFLYSEHYDWQFHLDAISELLRVSQEVRIFLLLTLMLEKSPYLDRIIEHFAALNYRVSIAPVEYELQKGANEMLVIQKL